MTLPTRRIVVLRASRDTVVLIASTVALTLALAYSVHQRPAPPAGAMPQPEHQVWAGQLAEVAPEPAAPAAPEPLTSASLTVPKAALALPPMPAAAVPRVARATPCDVQPCPAKAAPPSSAPLPPARQKPAAAESEKVAAAVPATSAKPVTRAKDRDRRFGLADLNPLPHLPDAVRKPFSYAGSKISGLIDWF